MKRLAVGMGILWLLACSGLGSGDVEEIIEEPAPAPAPAAIAPPATPDLTCCCETAGGPGGTPTFAVVASSACVSGKCLAADAAECKPAAPAPAPVPSASPAPAPKAAPAPRPRPRELHGVRPKPSGGERK